MRISGITPVEGTPLAESQSGPLPAQREVSQTQADDFAKAVQSQPPVKTDSNKTDDEKFQEVLLLGIVNNIVSEAQRNREELKQIMEEEN
jgi:hypothetical protein